MDGHSTQRKLKHQGGGQSEVSRYNEMKIGHTVQQSEVRNMPLMIMMHAGKREKERQDEALGAPRNAFSAYSLGALEARK